MDASFERVGMGKGELGWGVVVLSQWVDTGVLVMCYRLRDPRYGLSEKIIARMFGACFSEMGCYLLMLMFGLPLS